MHTFLDCDISYWGGITVKLPILTWPHKILETKSEPVVDFDDKLKEQVRSMHETMLAAQGIGLAANQVGLTKRLIVIEIPSPERDQEDGATEEVVKDWHDKTFVLINPKILKKTGKISYQEGCLSFPELFDFVDRAAEIEVEAQNENGETYRFHADGLMSVCVQHEIDHIDGIVFIDRMSRLKSSRIKKQIERRGRLAVEAEA